MTEDDEGIGEHLDPRRVVPAPPSVWRQLGAFTVRSPADVPPEMILESAAHLQLGDDVELAGDERFGSVRLDLLTGQSYWRPALTPAESNPLGPVGGRAPLTGDELELMASLVAPGSDPSAASPPRCSLAPNLGPQPFLLDPDRRVRFRGDRSQFPWRAFARIAGAGFQQSGAFVGPRHVVTCAHALWNCVPKLGCFLWSGDRGIKVHFGAPGYWRYATDILIPYAWWRKGSAAGVNFDYALLIVAPDGNYSPGHFTLAPGSDRDIVFTMSYGFPVRNLFCKDSPAPSLRCSPWGRCGDELYGMAMTAYTRRRTYFEGPFNSLGGQSGAAFYRDIGGQRRVFGVLRGTRATAGGHYGQRAVAKRFGPVSSAQIAWWIRHCPGACR